MRSGGEGQGSVEEQIMKLVGATGEGQAFLGMWVEVFDGWS